MRMRGKHVTTSGWRDAEGSARERIGRRDEEEREKDGRRNTDIGGIESAIGERRTGGSWPCTCECARVCVRVQCGASD